MAGLGEAAVQLWWLLVCLFTAAMAASVSDTDLLLAFKESLVDPDQSLRSWDKGTAVCAWEGVVCSSGEVTGLNIHQSNVSGPLNPAICGIPTLQSLEILGASISGGFPEGLFSCTNLTYLTVSTTLMQGPIPDGFSALKKLQVLDLSICSFNGTMPPSVGDLQFLTKLDLSVNQFSGAIPSSYQKLTKLQYLVLNKNPLDAGPIPDFVWTLSELVYLDLSDTGRSGEISEAIGNLAKLQTLYLADNSLSGQLPGNLSKVRALEDLWVNGNGLSGEFPAGMGEMRNMTYFIVDDNFFSGSLPAEFVQWKQLQYFSVYNNSISGGIPAGFGDLTELSVFSLLANNMSGTVDEGFGANSKLARFEVAMNGFWGPVPPWLCNSGLLHTLSIQSNFFSGDFPSSYANCTSLTGINAYQNNLTGNLPLEVWNSSKMAFIDISSNSMSGNVPPEVGNAVKLQTLRIFDNRFYGVVPPELGQAAGLVVLQASNNSFVGGIPHTLGQLVSLTKLQLDGNFLSGAIPAELGGCQNLTSLTLAGNQLSGSIPSSLAQLPSLNELDLSRNRLRGRIPASFAKISNFNFSDNQLCGALPTGMAWEAYQQSLQGNPGLQKPCSRPPRWPRIVAACLGAITVALLLCCCCSLYRKVSKYRKELEVEEQKAGPWRMSSFQQLSFTEYDLVGKLKEENLLGSGGSGRVYKVELPSGQIVAVKKLYKASKGFQAEVETLGKNTRHRNIVKLLCCCSNDQDNLLVYEYMENGSLGNLLHGSHELLLDWPTRLHIAIGAASGLAYLHHQCVPQILHRDVKSNNILLDSQLEARVGDFGLAKFINTLPVPDTSTTGFAGSFGYIAPEYGYSYKITEKSDIYSLGVVLLELVTGRQAIQMDVYGEGTNLAGWAWEMYQCKKSKELVLDARLAGESEESMLAVLQVALICTDPRPENRPSMADVLYMLLQCAPLDAHHPKLFL